MEIQAFVEIEHQVLVAVAVTVLGEMERLKLFMELIYDWIVITVQIYNAIIKMCIQQRIALQEIVHYNIQLD